MTTSLELKTARNKERESLFNKFNEISNKISNLKTILQNESYTPTDKELSRFFAQMDTSAIELCSIKNEIVMFYTRD